MALRATTLNENGWSLPGYFQNRHGGIHGERSEGSFPSSTGEVPVKEEASLRVRFQLTPADLFQIRLTNGCLVWGMVWLFILSGLSSIEPIVRVFKGQASMHEWPTFMAVFQLPVLIGVAACVCWLDCWWDATRSRRELATIGLCILEISPEGLLISSQRSESRSQWSVVTHIRATRHHICLWMGEAPYVIPRRAFSSPEEAEAFLQAATAWHRAATTSTVG
jgi:hypothetical protein